MLAAAQVRAAIVARLLGATAAGARVFPARAWPLAAQDLPALRVGPGDETMESDDIGWPQVLQHELDIEIEAHVAAADEIDQVIDDLAEQVLAALLAEEDDATLAPLPNCSLAPRGIRRLPVAEGQAATGRALIRITASFQTVSNNPSTLV